MHKIMPIQKRKELINFFLNEDREYTKEEVLNKEFAVLTFSPNEEYIDYVKTDFDHICVDLDTHDFSEDSPEIYIKGIIIDVDNQKNYSIIHLQNKNNNVSISFAKNVVFHYSDYFNIGDVVIVKCHTHDGKIYAHFLVDFQYEDNFESEKRYMTDELKEYILDYYQDPDSPLLALIRQCTYFKSAAKGTPCIRFELYAPNGEREAITCKHKYNPLLPENLKAGDFIEYNESNDPFISNVRVKR